MKEEVRARGREVRQGGGGGPPGTHVAGGSKRETRRCRPHRQGWASDESKEPGDKGDSGGDADSAHGAASVRGKREMGDAPYFVAASAVTSNAILRSSRMDVPKPQVC